MAQFVANQVLFYIPQLGEEQLLLWANQRDSEAFERQGDEKKTKESINHELNSE